MKKANIEYVLLAGSSLFLCEPCTLCVRMLLVGRVSVCVRAPYFQGKMTFQGSQKLKIFQPRRGGASRPALPRRLEAGAANSCLFSSLPKVNKPEAFFLPDLLVFPRSLPPCIGVLTAPAGSDGPSETG